MSSLVEKKLEIWKKKLLDMGKRNRLLNYRDLKRGTLKITSPDYEQLYKTVVVDEKSLTFPHYSGGIPLDTDEKDVPSGVKVLGSFKTDQSVKECNKTAKALRAKARTFSEEQGVNVLYLVFGFLEWKEQNTSTSLNSPLVLVPVVLSQTRVTDPYKLNIDEEEIILNPTLAYKMEKEYALNFPDFYQYSNDIDDYLDSIEDIIAPLGWNVRRDVSLALLSFAKINMYKDLEHRSSELLENELVQAIAGEMTDVSSDISWLKSYKHDETFSPQKTFQILDADSSQQDAILLSKKGVNFVLQGPPGTGKSQTIANIIAEAIADGKKVLFVSEKMAALDVVYKRLATVGLDDFCLVLHSCKVNKREFLDSFGLVFQYSLPLCGDVDVSSLDELNTLRDRLNGYCEQLHRKIQPLEQSAFDAYGILANLETAPDVAFCIEGCSIHQIDRVRLNEMNSAVNLLASARKKLTEDWKEHPWRYTTIKSVSHETRHNLTVLLEQLLTKGSDYLVEVEKFKNDVGLNLNVELAQTSRYVDALDFFATAQRFPEEWLELSKEELNSLAERAERLKSSQTLLNTQKKYLAERFNPGFFEIDVDEYQGAIEENIREVRRLLNKDFARRKKSVSFKEMLSISKLCQSGVAKLVELQSTLHDVACEVGLEAPERLSEIPDFLAFIRDFSKEMKASSFWFEQQWRDTSRRGKIFREAFVLTEELANCKKDILRCWAKNDLELERFISDYEDDVVFYDWIIARLDEVRPRFEAIQKEADKLISAQLDEVESTVCQGRVLLKELRTLIERVADGLKLEPPKYLSEIPEFCERVQLCSENIKPNEFWFDSAWSNKTERMNLCRQADKLIKELSWSRNELLQDCEKSVLEFDYRAVDERFKTEYLSLFRVFKKSYRQDCKSLRLLFKVPKKKFTFDDATELLLKIKHYREALESFTEKTTIFERYMGGWFNGEYTDFSGAYTAFQQFETLVKHYQGNIPDELKRSILRGDNVGKYSSEIARINELIHAEIPISRLQILTKTPAKDDDLLNLDQKVGELCEKIVAYRRNLANTDSGTNTGQNDRRGGEFWDSNTSFSLEQFLVFWRLLLRYCDLFQRLLQRRSLFSDYLGGWFIGKGFDMSCIEGASEAFSCFERLISRFPNTIPLVFRERILAGTNVALFEQEAERIETLADGDETIEKLLSVVQTASTNDSFSLLEASAGKIKEHMDRLVERVEDVASHAIPDAPHEFELDALKKLGELKKTEADLLKENESVKADFFFLYDGLDTDWNVVQERIDWVVQFKTYADCLSLPMAFQHSVASGDTVVGKCRQLARYLRSFIDEYLPLHDQLVHCFEESVWSLLDSAGKTSEFVKRLRANIGGLEDWIEFKTAKERCENLGLESLVRLALESGLDVDCFESAFLKRFECLWLDSVMPQLPAVKQFTSGDQNSCVKKFRELDVRQFEIASNRLRKKLLDEYRRISISSSSSERNELKTLQREYGKKRRIMPVRKLLDSIPTLLPKLKPCLMTSPLSVSLFLQSDIYEFDLVVFDEASQVRTENAIGAISRCKQAIIAGDSKQLPPTSFFTATLSGSDEYDEEDDDSDSYESILDEIGGILPQLTLKWHYRSRNEALITFSNRKIYGGELTTFPEPFDVTRDGVEFIYVKDGFYQRSGKRDNPVEAKRVVDLIYEQFREHPERSVGVVTFSDAQRKCIEDIIDKRRNSDPTYEDFFREDREEPFFIKNLENVQGDERDTIIFSVGYGKTGPNEPLYMNFGPINRIGGERRLNVAVTRAKYAVKVVSSIHACDMRVTETSPKGVQLLQEYLKFAEFGVQALDGDNSSVNEKEMKSSFENTVCQFLRSKGYDVATRVGCSEYRIDMAIRHPSAPGKYVLGIECDGLSYRDAKSARDRDRLRQQVLETMGWRFYRVWSPDWVKNPKAEGKRLVAAVEDAIERSVIGRESSFKDSKTEFASSLFEQGDKVGSIELDRYTATDIETETIDSIDENGTVSNEFKFELYHRLNFIASQSPKRAISSAIRDLLGDSTPIHIDFLKELLAPLFGVPSMTKEVDDAVDQVILSDSFLNLVDIRGDFLWRKGQYKVVPKIPATSYDVRPFAYISFEELIEAEVIILRKRGPLARGSLFRILASEYGLAYDAELMRPRLNASIVMLKKSGRVDESGGKVMLKS